MVDIILLLGISFATRLKNCYRYRLSFGRASHLDNQRWTHAEIAMKGALLRLSNSLGLLIPASRALELIQTLGAIKNADGTAGVPVPAPYLRVRVAGTAENLRVRVAGTAEIGWFLERGRIAEECVRGALMRARRAARRARGDPWLRLWMRVCAATLAGSRRAGLRYRYQRPRDKNARHQCPLNGAFYATGSKNREPPGSRSNG